jgi:Spy/CpxP family protein refolding chaperone
MSEQDKEELTRGERAAEFERRMMNLFERLSERAAADAEGSRRRDEELQRRAEGTQRTIEFIVQQQAQFSTDMQRLRESQEQNEERWARTGEEIRALLAIAEIHEREIVELRQTQAEAQARTDVQMTETDRRMAETDERLNALINTVERIISERRNGGRGEGNSE